MDRIVVLQIQVASHGALVEFVKHLRIGVECGRNASDPRVKENVHEDLLALVQRQGEHVHLPALCLLERDGKLRYPSKLGRSWRRASARHIADRSWDWLCLHVHQIDKNASCLVCHIFCVDDIVLESDARYSRELFECPLQEDGLIRDVFMDIRIDLAKRSRAPNVLILGQFDDCRADLSNHPEHSLERLDDDAVYCAAEVRCEASHDHDDEERHGHVRTIFSALGIAEVEEGSGLRTTCASTSGDEAVGDLLLHDVLQAERHLFVC
mmetsp:Transcript_13723/g.30219  ORF Transcript_13723/g.30219 Transcript_13723/m.30219 type:complete len:267 (-) Transcript_13723:474-1274(-)